MASKIFVAIFSMIIFLFISFSACIQQASFNPQFQSCGDGNCPVSGDASSASDCAGDCSATKSPLPNCSELGGECEEECSGLDYLSDDLVADCPENCCVCCKKKVTEPALLTCADKGGKCKEEGCLGSEFELGEPVSDCTGNCCVCCKQLIQTCEEAGGICRTDGCSPSEWSIAPVSDCTFCCKPK